MSYKKLGLFPPSPTTTRGISTKLSASKEKVVYTNGKAVIIRDLTNPPLSVAYSGHVHNASVARISPSGYYCASADASGTVKIWDTVGEDQTLKGEYKVISGKINDLAWDGESKRIIAVGDGREKFGHPFIADSGSSTGEISGHSKAINAVAIRHQRPFKAATAADDGVIVFHQGVPYKYEKTIKTHTKFVQDIQYAASGDHFASVGSDAKAFLYDGKTGDTLGEFENAHKGTIMACSWNPDNKFLATASLDCTVKLWDVETRKSTSTWTLGTGVPNQQVGIVFTNAQTLVSLSMSGDLNIFDTREGDKPASVVTGTQRAITAITPLSSSTFLAGVADGRVLSFETATGKASDVSGNRHTNLVSGLTSTPSGKVFSAGYDDTVREIEGSNFVPATFPTASQPKSITVIDDGTTFIAEINGVEVVKSNQKVFDLKTKYSAGSIAAHDSLVAIGGDDSKVHLAVWDGKELTETAVLEGNKDAVTAIAFSPDGTLLASGDSKGRICLFNVKGKELITSRWSFHSARVNSLAWTADGKHCASGSLDTHLYVWSVEKPVKNIAIKNAGPGGVNSVLWVGSGKLASAGADGCVRVWEVTFHT